LTVDYTPTAEDYQPALAEIDRLLAGIDLTPRQAWEIRNAVVTVAVAARAVEPRQHAGRPPPNQAQRDVPPGFWFDLGIGLYLRVEPLHDPLLRQDVHRTWGARDEHGNTWGQALGNNAGVMWQTVKPDEGELL
jgi:hypothetical protein